MRSFREETGLSLSESTVDRWQEMRGERVGQWHATKIPRQTLDDKQPILLFELVGKWIINISHIHTEIRIHRLIYTRAQRYTHTAIHIVCTHFMHDKKVPVFCSNFDLFWFKENILKWINTNFLSGRECSEWYNDFPCTENTSRLSALERHFYLRTRITGLFAI